MVDKEVKAAFYVCASICGKDGIISELEELTIIQKFMSNFGLNESDLEQLFEDFFNSKHHIDEYLKRVTTKSLRGLIYEIARVSATSDDLDVRENIALERARLVWGLDSCQEK